MNIDQLGGVIRSVMLLFSGWALEHGFTQDQYVAITGGVIAIVSVLWSLYSNSTNRMIQSVAEKPEVAKVITTEPGLAIQIPSDKVMAR
jgi:hypothetical protein